jgi:hypothetical protein
MFVSFQDSRKFWVGKLGKLGGRCYKDLGFYVVSLWETDLTQWGTILDDIPVDTVY